VDGLTLATSEAAPTAVKALQFGNVQDLSLTGLANIARFQARSVAAGTLEANSVTKLNVTGDMLADLSLAGEQLNGADVLGLASVRGGVTGATWVLTGTAGRIQLGGDATGFTMRSTDSVDSLSAAHATDFQVTVGLTAGALDNGIAAASEIANADAMLGSVRIGGRRGAGNAAAGAGIILAAPNFGAVRFDQIDDLGAADGSVLWMNSDAIGTFTSKNSSVGGLTWTYRPSGATPWDVTLEPIQEIA
jgi:hypothetical protein